MINWVDKIQKNDKNTSEILRERFYVLVANI